MNDGVQQQTQRIDENMPFLALDQFARIKSVRIDVRPPCMGCFLSSGFRAAHLSLFDLEPVSSPRPAVLQSRRAQEVSRLAVAPTLRHTLALPGHTLTASSTTARLVRSG
jgi:hypothetical protein